MSIEPHAVTSVSTPAIRMDKAATLADYLANIASRLNQWLPHRRYARFFRRLQGETGRIKRPAKVLEHRGRPNRNRSDEERVMAIKQIRPIRVEGNVAYVPLTKGAEAIIDAADVYLVEGHNWCLNVKETASYAMRRGPRPDGASIYLHRVILSPKAGLVVDHIDGDGLNNRRSNLRVATNAENIRNGRMKRNNASGYKGVFWNTQRGKWQARIRLDRKTIHLGLFRDIEAAAYAYAQASAKLHGEFGRVG